MDVSEQKHAILGVFSANTLDYLKGLFVQITGVFQKITYIYIGQKLL
jgi:hypothetical protein